MSESSIPYIDKPPSPEIQVETFDNLALRYHIFNEWRRGGLAQFSKQPQPTESDFEYPPNITEDFLSDYIQSGRKFSDTDIRLATMTPDIFVPVYNRMMRNKHLLSPLGESQRESYLDDEITICIPISITETDSTIETLIDQLRKSLKKFGKSSRVIIWVNCKYIKEDDEEINNTARTRYFEITKMFEILISDCVHVEAGFDMTLEKDFSMSSLRRNYMDTLVCDIVDGKMSPLQPVIWLDADTTFISRDCFTEVANTIKDSPLCFVHPTVNYSLEWTNGKHPKDWDDPSKVLLIDEMARRASRRTINGEPASVAVDEYVEESGLAFSMLTYLLSGINTKDPINESSRLISNYKYFFRDFKDRSSLPGSIVSLYGNVPLNVNHSGVVSWLGAQIRTSGRRIYIEMINTGSFAPLLVGRSASCGTDYQLATEMGPDHKAKKTNEFDINRAVLSLYNDKAGASRINPDYIDPNIAKEVISRMAVNGVLGIGVDPKDPYSFYMPYE